MIILNLTQHPSTPEQREAGVIDLQGDTATYLRQLLTFDKIQDTNFVEARAMEIAEIAVRLDIYHVMIGGEPFLMAPLEKALRFLGRTPMYAFSKQVSYEIEQEDGSIKKINTFKHEGFVVTSDD